MNISNEEITIKLTLRNHLLTKLRKLTDALVDAEQTGDLGKIEQLKERFEKTHEKLISEIFAPPN